MCELLSCVCLLMGYLQNHSQTWYRIITVNPETYQRFRGVHPPLGIPPCSSPPPLLVRVFSLPSSPHPQVCGTRTARCTWDRVRSCALSALASPVRPR